ncbi:MAG TPA: glycosyltransferase family 4 protein [Bryobacteraceae bacterium]|nr:glycosyltransferase family 4 protein [Bryobacteraceae bacterium]
MRILCVYGNSYGGGTETVLLDGLPIINNTPGIRLTFYDLYSRTSVVRKFEDLHIPICRTGRLDDSPILSLRSGLQRKLDILAAIPRHLRIVLQLHRAFGECDVVYVHGYKDLALSQVARIAGARSSLPIVWHCHGLDDGVELPFLATLANGCARVVAISEDVRRHLIALGVRASIVHTVYNAVDHKRITNAAVLPPVQPLPPVRGRTIVLVCPAAIRPVKGIHLAIQALSSLPPTVDLWITGDTSDAGASEYLDRLLTLAKHLGVIERVYFLGVRKDLPSVMQSAHVICVPSVWREGFGLVAAEAMTLGKPIVTSSRGALPEVVGEDGLIFDPNQPGDLVQKLATLISDPALAASLGADARRSALRRFGYDRWADEVATQLRAAFPLDAAA